MLIFRKGPSDESKIGISSDWFLAISSASVGLPSYQALAAETRDARSTEPETEDPIEDPAEVDAEQDVTPDDAISEETLVAETRSPAGRPLMVSVLF